jgi:hypothetical protein
MKNLFFLFTFFSIMFLISCSKDSTSEKVPKDISDNIETEQRLRDPLFSSDLCEYYTFATLCPDCLNFPWSQSNLIMTYLGCEIRINYEHKTCIGANGKPYFYFYITSYDVIDKNCINLALIDIGDLEIKAKIFLIKNATQPGNGTQVGFFESSCSSFCVDNLNGDNDTYWVRFNPIPCENSTCCTTTYSVDSKNGIFELVSGNNTYGGPPSGGNCLGNFPLAKCSMELTPCLPDCYLLQLGPL